MGPEKNRGEFCPVAFYVELVYIVPPNKYFFGSFGFIGNFMIVYLFCSCLVEKSLFGIGLTKKVHQYLELF